MIIEQTIYGLARLIVHADRSVQTGCPRPRFRISTTHLITNYLFAFMFASGFTPARAEVRVSGEIAAMSIDASQSKISEILAALERDYKVQYRTSIALDTPITAAYSGSLKEVLARVLVGYTYVIRQTETSAEVVVIGKRGDRAIVGAATPSASPGKNLAAQWRTTLDAASLQNGNSRSAPKPDR